MDEHLGRKGPHISRCLSLLRNRGLLHGTFQEDGVQVGWSYHVLPPMPFHTHTQHLSGLFKHGLDSKCATPKGSMMGVLTRSIPQSP